MINLRFSQRILSDCGRLRARLFHSGREKQGYFCHISSKKFSKII
nr:MAG TPA_asm: hypothetical protein [Caudoviricetes sp.]